MLTSDHGEFFGEHSLVGHSNDVYQEVLKVPLLIREPGQDAGRIDYTHVVSDDVARMILSEFPDLFEDRHLRLFPNTPGNHPVMSENYYAGTKNLFHEDWGWRFQRVRSAIFEWPYKYIHSSDGQHELFHLVKDPRELQNRIDAESQIASRLEEEWELFRKQRKGPQTPMDQRDLSEKDIKRLRSLGYAD